MSALRDVLGDPEIGWAGACLYNERTQRLIDGHARKTAVGPATPVPVLVGDWSEAAEKKILLTLDPLAGMATPDPDKLKDLLDDVTLDTEALSALGDELMRQLDHAIAKQDRERAVVQDTPPDRPVEVQRCKAGDLWALGKHRLLCGDSRNGADVARLLGGEKINLAVTSPPYASQREYDEASGFKPIPPDEYVGWWDLVQAVVRAHLAADGSFFINIKPHCDNGQRSLYVMDMVLAMVRRWGWRFVDEFCWYKQGMPGVFGDRFKNEWEPVYHFALGPCKVRHLAVGHESQHVPAGSVGSNARMQGKGDPLRGRGKGLAAPGNVLKVAPDSAGVGTHEARFPVGLPAFFIKAFSDPNDVILDAPIPLPIGDVVFEPFGGAGTTLVAAEQLARRCFAVEISPTYCDTILARWEKLTGGKAERVQ